jgi:His/Glu/Gln/Arg/opine family amino acid ABC transporter permease subunit
MNFFGTGAQPGILSEYGGSLLHGALMTVVLTLGCLAVSTAIAVPLAVVRESRSIWSRLVAGYTWLLLTLPQLLVIFFMFYGLPVIGITIPAVLTAILALGLTTSAYNIEIFRSGISAVPRGQFESARALGMSSWHVWTRIVLPQALPVIIPPFISNATLAVKGTALAAVVTVPELTSVAMGIINETSDPIAPLVTVAVGYLIINSILTGLQALAERKYGNRSRSVKRTTLRKALR